MTRTEAIELINRDFERAAKVWERGNNSGCSATSATYNRCDRLCDRYRERAEYALARLFPGIRVDYPGLYPSFEYEGNHYHTLESVERHAGPKG
jgi:hypothetical protein